MSYWRATKTLEAIDTLVTADGGNSYRGWLGQIMPHMGDAYRNDEDGYRSHLGASVIGGDCERAVWYGYRWAYKRLARGRKGEHPVSGNARMVRLWNRGHMEEARFIALLLMIGVQVYQQDASGKQYRLSDFGGHFSGSGDGFAVGIPDLPWGVPALLECKTHNDKSFTKLVEEGVRYAKPTHYVQMQIYMGKFGLQYAIYFAVNKNDDTLHAEIVMYDGPCDAAFLERARRLIYNGHEAPPRIRNASPGYHVCKYLCDFPDVCFNTEPVDRNCRTCQFAFPMPDGTWQCAKYTYTLSKEEQQWGCAAYQVMDAMKKC
jgi:hypothetical protein